MPCMPPIAEDALFDLPGRCRDPAADAPTPASRRTDELVLDFPTARDSPCGARSVWHCGPTIRDAGRMSAVRIRRREAGAQGDWPGNYPPLAAGACTRRAALAWRRASTAARRPARRRKRCRASRRRPCASRQRDNRTSWSPISIATAPPPAPPACAGLRMLGARNLASMVPNRAVHWLRTDAGAGRRTRQPAT